MRGIHRLHSRGLPKTLRKGGRGNVVPPVISYAAIPSAAIDYRKTEYTNPVDSALLTLHSRFSISILNMNISQGQAGAVGALFVTALRAAKPAQVILQYSIATQTYDADFGAPTFAPIYDKINAGGTDGVSWWAKNAATGLKTKTSYAAAYTSWEINLNEETVPNASGFRASEEIANGYYTLVLDTLYPAGLDGVFIDNVWGNAGSSAYSGATTDSAGNSLGVGVVGDYTLDGTNDSGLHNGAATRLTSPAPNYRKGHARYAARTRALSFANHGFNAVLMANADSQIIDDPTYAESALTTTELVGIYDYAFLEGLSGASSSLDTYRNIFADVMRRYATAADSCTHGAMLSCYVSVASDTASWRLQKCRYITGIVAMRDNGWVCVADQVSGVQIPYWFNEIDHLYANVGSAIDAVQTAATTEGIWKRRFENGCVLLNPTANKSRFMNTILGTFTIQRAADIVTITWVSGATPFATILGVTPVDGVTTIRIWNCTSDGGSFNGIFTVTAHTAQTVSWSDAGSNTSAISKPLGHFGFKSTIDMTGLGYKAFLGTDDAHNDPDAASGAITSINNGAVLTTVSLWPSDALIAVKV